MRVLTFFGLLPLLFSCGGAATVSGTQATSAQAGHSLAYKGEECHAVWQRPKDASGADLPWSDTSGPSGAAWAKGPGVHDGTNEKQVMDLICFDTLADDQTIKRHIAFDDRRFDVAKAAILVDECVESGKCTSSEEVAGVIAWYAHSLDQSKLSAVSKKLDLPQPVRDAFVDRTVANIAKMDEFLGKLTGTDQAYYVKLPSDVRAARDAYYQGRRDQYAKLDRMLEDLDKATPHHVDATLAPTLLVLRGEAVVRCPDAVQCERDPLFVEVTRALVRAHVLADEAFEAKAEWELLGKHGARGTIASQIWSAQSEWRQRHKEVKAPMEANEEMADPTASMADPGIERARAEVASTTAGPGGMTKVTFKDPGAAPAAQVCEDNATVDHFGAVAGQVVPIYKQDCKDAPKAVKVAPILVRAAEASKVKPGETMVAVVTGPTRRAAVLRVHAGDKVVQLGADRLGATSGDPLKTDVH